MERCHKVTQIFLTKLSRQKPNGGTSYINEIHFETPTGEIYIAEEPVDTMGTSYFKEGLINCFKVTHPGRPPRMDWVQWVGLPGNVVVNREKLMVAQNCLLKVYEMQLLRGALNADALQEDAGMLAQMVFTVAETL